ncbi:MAG: SusC/RagA family TonB-linked outer membrane protein, partial [Bacteroidales bacterium]|nr:SusC/RagA family TonB-linked outer membrane protein [Bacteroidales bacterium]
TDLEGNFQISVLDPGSTLVFSYVGMKSEEVQLDGQTTINLTMTEDIAALEEAVVIGYGAVRKSDLTGSVVSIKNEEIERVPVVTLEQAMQGRAAGVQVTTSSHKPGGGISVRVRGGTSINAGVEPLYVVDGFPVSSESRDPISNDNRFIPSAGGTSVPYNLLSTLNPNDIESIEILKDASSTAIYGARGANGVVLITTKRGRKGKPQVDYSTHFALKKVSRKIEMLNGQEFAELYNEYNINKGIPPLFNGENRNYPLPEDIGEGTDWQDQIFRQGWEMNHQLSVAGGSDNTQYAISGNYNDEQGVVLGGDFTRYSIRANVDTRVIDRLKIGTNLSTSRITANGSGSESNTESDFGGTIESASVFAPTVYVYDRDGNWGENNVPGLETRGNPVAMATLSTDKMIADRLIGNAYLDLEIIEGLNFKVSVGTNLINSRSDLYYPMETNVGRKVDGSASKSYMNTVSLLNENILTYNNLFGGIHKVNAVAGYTRQQEVSEGSGVETAGFV